MNPKNVPSPDTFATVLSAATQARGLSLERIRARLEQGGVPVSIATLSYWQSGRSLPTRSRSYHTLVELEKVLNLEPGHLTRHTHTSDGRSRREAFEWQSVVPDRDLATQIIADLGLAMQGQLTRVTMLDHLVINADRTEASQESRAIWRAERNGLPRWPIVVAQDTDTPGAAVATIEPLFGCQLGEFVDVPERQLVVAEMLGLRALQRGDLFTGEYRINFAPTTSPSFRMQRSVAESVRSLALCVTFDPDALPTRVEARVQPAIDEPATEVEPVELARNQAQFIRTDVKPGVYSLYWEWE